MTWADVYLYDSVTGVVDPVQSRFFADLGEERFKALESAPLLKDLIKRVGEVEGIKKWVEKRA